MENNEQIIEVEAEEIEGTEYIIIQTDSQVQMINEIFNYFK